MVGGHGAQDTRIAPRRHGAQDSRIAPRRHGAQDSRIAPRATVRRDPFPGCGHLAKGGMSGAADSAAGSGGGRTLRIIHPHSGQ